MVQSRSPQIFAHRGARLDAPENTLPAFARALELGVDGIELDVHLSRDGQLVVIHDFELESTTSGRGGVSEKCAAELAALDAGSHFAPRFAHIGIPTLEQVFDLVGDRCRINVEVKSIAPDGGPAAEVLLATLRRRSLFDQVIVSSFNVPTLTKLRALEPAVALGVLYLEPITPEQEAEWLSPALQPQALHPHYTLVSTEFVHRAHSHGLAVNVWTVNEVDDARALQQLGVDAIITDAPDLLMGHLMP